MQLNSALGILVLLAITGCAGDGTAPDPAEPDGPGPELSAVERGSAAFRRSCASCHASRDGFDLAFFDYPDSTIIRRAVKHVEQGVAEDIAAYINSLGVSPASRHTRLFQPGGATLDSDADLALRLFGHDQWPLDLEPAELRALRPRTLPIGLPLLEWSVEESELDWMPDQPLPEPLLNEQDGVLRGALDRYYETRTMVDLVAALDLFDALTRGGDTSDRVCAGGVATHVRPDRCFDTRRWMATLAAQHLLREGADEVPLRIIDLWWDVGEAAVSQSIDRVGRTAERQSAYASSARWLWLAWMLDPVREADNPLYFAEQLFHAGYPRHAVFAMLYSMVLEPAGWDGARPYIFHLQVYHRAPDSWVYNAALWGYDYIEGLLDAGIRPTGTGYDHAVSMLDIAARIVADPAQVTVTAERRQELLETIARLRAKVVG